jgi:hypothetical protein
MSDSEDMKKAIEEMAEGLGLPQETLDAVFAPLPELEDFDIEKIVTFGEFVNTPEGTEFVTVCRKDGYLRTINQHKVENLEIKQGKEAVFDMRYDEDDPNSPPNVPQKETELFDCEYLNWSDGEGDPQVQRQGDDVLMENVGGNIRNNEGYNTWTYTVYKVKKS